MQKDVNSGEVIDKMLQETIEDSWTWNLILGQAVACKAIIKNIEVFHLFLSELDNDWQSTKLFTGSS